MAEEAHNPAYSTVTNEDRLEKLTYTVGIAAELGNVEEKEKSRLPNLK